LGPAELEYFAYCQKRFFIESIGLHRPKQFAMSFAKKDIAISGQEAVNELY
jgi:hypothetical protein